MEEQEIVPPGPIRAFREEEGKATEQQEQVEIFSYYERNQLEILLQIRNILQQIQESLKDQAKNEEEQKEDEF